MKSIKKLFIALMFAVLSTVAIAQSGWSTGNYYAYQGDPGLSGETILLGIMLMVNRCIIDTVDKPTGTESIDQDIITHGQTASGYQDGMKVISGIARGHHGTFVKMKTTIYIKIK